MKRVSFEVAKAIKKAGFHEMTSFFYIDTYDDEDNPTHQFELCGASIPSYVQDWNDTNKHPEYNEVHINYWDNFWSAPTYLEVWLWLWREEKAFILVDGYTNGKLSSKETESEIYDSEGYLYTTDKCMNPEEAIVSAIEYLVENKLLK